MGREKQGGAWLTRHEPLPGLYPNVPVKGANDFFSQQEVTHVRFLSLAGQKCCAENLLMAMTKMSMPFQSSL
jgi:hypothetical protein